MRIDCPGCAATYEVPQPQLRPGRTVQCARCEMHWKPAGGLPEPRAVAVVRAASTALRQSAIRVQAPAPEAETPERRPLAWRGAAWRGAAPWGIGWAASIVLLVGLVAAAGHWRETVMHGWPPSIRLYSALGAATPRS